MSADESAPVRRKSRLRLVVKILVGLPFVWWLYTKFFWPSTILDTPEILANLYAKEICSCVYIVGQTDENCISINEQFLKPGRVLIDRPKREVNVRVFWGVAQARYFGANEGCRIQVL